MSNLILNQEAVIFLRLQAADVDQAWAILRSIYENPIFPLGGQWSQASIEREIEAGQSFGLFGRSKDLLAFILMRELEEAWDVQILATRQDHQRQGLMGQLLEQVVKVKPAAKALWLEVHGQNLPAQKFYKKHGFREVGRRPRYYRDGAEGILYSLG